MLIYENDLESIIPTVKGGDIIFLYGDLGAGKTTFTRSLLRKIGLPDNIVVRSPTYTYMQEYSVNIDDTSTRLYHFDLYRVENYDIFVNIGAEEIFEDTNAIKIVEWPEKIESRYQANILVKITKTENDNIRNITITRYD